MKAGSVVPLGGVALTSEDPATRNLTVAIFGDGSLPWRLEGSSGLELRSTAPGKISAIPLGAKAHGYRVVEVRHMGTA